MSSSPHQHKHPRKNQRKRSTEPPKCLVEMGILVDAKSKRNCPKHKCKAFECLPPSRGTVSPANTISSANLTASYVSVPPRPHREFHGMWLPSQPYDSRMTEMSSFSPCSSSTHPGSEKKPKSGSSLYTRGGEVPHGYSKFHAISDGADSSVLNWSSPSERTPGPQARGIRGVFAILLHPGNMRPGWGEWDNRNGNRPPHLNSASSVGNSNTIITSGSSSGQGKSNRAKRRNSKSDKRSVSGTSPGNSKGLQRSTSSPSLGNSKSAVRSGSRGNSNSLRRSSSGAALGSNKLRRSASGTAQGKSNSLRRTASGTSLGKSKRLTRATSSTSLGTPKNSKGTGRRRKWLLW